MKQKTSWLVAKITLILPVVLMLAGCGISLPGSQVSSPFPTATFGAMPSKTPTMIESTQPPATLTPSDVLATATEFDRCRRVPEPRLNKTNASNVYLSGTVYFCIYDYTQTSFDFDSGVLGSTDENPTADIRFEFGGIARLDGTLRYYLSEANYAYVEPSEINSPSPGDCKKLISVPTRLSLVSVAVGATGCVLTNEGRLAFFRVEKLEPFGAESIDVSFVVWNIPASALPPELPTRTPSPEPTTTATSAFPPSDIVKNQCVETSPELPANVETQGMIVLYGVDSFLLDPKSGAKKTLRERQFDFTVSPNYKWLASSFQDSQRKLWLLVETANGEEQKPIPWDEENWFEIGGWLDNERVWISHYPGPALTLVNPFTGERQELAGDFPGIQTAESIHRYPLGVSNVMYNTSLSLAVYPRLEEDGSYYLVLWDLQTKHVLAKIKHILKAPQARPVWSPDGTKVYMIESRSETESDNIFSLSQDGQVRQLTHFGELVDDARIFGLSISPNGKKIAFWLSLGPNFPLKEPLAVLDIETGQVINYCITGPSEYGGLSVPTWSPDSRYLVIAQWYETVSSRTVLLDTWQGWAANVAKGVTPEGWIINNPSQ